MRQAEPDAGAQERLRPERETANGLLEAVSGRAGYITFDRLAYWRSLVPQRAEIGDPIDEVVELHAAVVDCARVDPAAGELVADRVP